MDITKIPGIMRKKNWTEGARIMETWFSRPPFIKPAYSTPPHLVDIDWALGFGATKDTYNKMINERVWANEPAKKEIKRWLTKQNLLNQSKNSFGDLTKTGEQLEEDYVNYRAVGSYLYYYYDYYYYSGMNDLTATLGRFVLRVAIAGTVEPTSIMNQHKVTVNEIGIYIRDTYDFEGDQSLGYWSESNNSVSYLNPLAGDHVSNESFRDWRSANGHGGDFLVFSNVKRLTVLNPTVFNI